MERRRYITPEIGIETISTDTVMTPIVLAGSSTGPKVGNQAPKHLKAY